MKKGKIKMVALTKSNDKNIVWYSYPTQDNQASLSVVNKMLNRFMAWATKNKRDWNKVQFYEQNQLIYEI